MSEVCPYSTISPRWKKAVFCETRAACCMLCVTITIVKRSRNSSINSSIRAEVLAVSDKSFSYNAANDAYFAVRDLRPAENLTLEQLLATKGIGQPPNIIAS